MWSRSVQQQAGSRSTGKPGSLQERRLLSISKQQPFRGGVVDAAEGVTRRGYVVSGVVIVALLLTSVLTLLSPALNHFQQHLTQFAAEDSPLDNATWNQSGYTSPAGCNSNATKLKVFMYDLPPEFHYGMITEFAPQGNNQIWPKNVMDVPKYPGGMYQQHSPEYWLITDLLTSDMADRTSPCTAFRVRRWQDADVVLVPYFASLSYNRYSRPAVPGRPKEWDKNQLLQEKLLEFLTAQPAWLAANGADHVIVIHHPNSMAHSRDRFRNVTFVVADFGRYGNDTANLLKDIVAPYKHVIPSFDGDDVSGAASFKRRPTLLFFRGAIVRKEGGVIRRELWEILREETDVVFSTGETTSAGIRSGAAGMQASKFCLHVAGDTPSSNRLFDAVASHCVPLVISDDLELPYEDVLDYTEFCVFVSSTLALQKGFVVDLLRNFSPTKWAEMHARMIQVQRHFQYQHPSVAGDAVHMIWDAIARKVPAFTLARNKLRRYARSRIG